jgi:hypothetical protein
MNRSPRPDPYQLLGVPSNASAQEIKQAYRRQAKRIHPDRNNSLSAAEAFHAVHLAYELLSDPARRKYYDERMVRSTQRPVRNTTERDRPAPTGRWSRPAVATEPAEPLGPAAPAWAFVGLHLTGLLFGLFLILGTFSLILFHSGHWAMLLFTAPGWFLVPDCWEGLRMKAKAGR